MLAPSPAARPAARCAPAHVVRFEPEKCAAGSLVAAHAPTHLLPRTPGIWRSQPAVRRGAVRLGQAQASPLRRRRGSRRRAGGPAHRRCLRLKPREALPTLVHVPDAWRLCLSGNCSAPPLCSGTGARASVALSCGSGATAASRASRWAAGLRAAAACARSGAATAAPCQALAARTAGLGAPHFDGLARRPLAWPLRLLQVPRYWKFVDSYPLTVSGKPQARRCTLAAMPSFHPYGPACLADDASHRPASHCLSRPRPSAVAGHIHVQQPLFAVRRSTRCGSRQSLSWAWRKPRAEVTPCSSSPSILSTSPFPPRAIQSQSNPRVYVCACTAFFKALHSCTLCMLSPS